MLGVALGEYFVGRCTGDAQTFMGRKFIAAGIDGAATTDFNPFNADPGRSTRRRSTPNPRERASRSHDLMEHVWGKARDEWAGKISLGEASSCNPKRRTFHARTPTATRIASVRTSGTRSRRTSRISNFSTTRISRCSSWWNSKAAKTQQEFEEEMDRYDRDDGPVDRHSSPPIGHTRYATMRGHQGGGQAGDALAVWNDYVSRVELSLPVKPTAPAAVQERLFVRDSHARARSDRITPDRRDRRWLPVRRRAFSQVYLGRAAEHAGAGHLGPEPGQSSRSM